MLIRLLSDQAQWAAIDCADNEVASLDQWHLLAHGSWQDDQYKADTAAGGAQVELSPDASEVWVSALGTDANICAAVFRLTTQAAPHAGGFPDILAFDDLSRLERGTQVCYPVAALRALVAKELSVPEGDVPNPFLMVFAIDGSGITTEGSAVFLSM